jgi:hypothetical protein
MLTCLSRSHISQSLERADVTCWCARHTSQQPRAFSSEICLSSSTPSMGKEGLSALDVGQSKNRRLAIGCCPSEVVKREEGEERKKVEDRAEEASITSLCVFVAKQQ